jgi:ABC-type glycerol-3-phosphate transport system substrate-binding protein
MPMNKLKTNTYKYLSFSAIFLSFFVLTGCTIPFLSKTPETVTLSYDSLWEPKGTYSDIISKYEGSVPNVKISYNDNSSSSLVSYKEDLLTRLRSGERVPDIMRIHVSWIPEFKEFLAPTVISAKEFNDTYYPGVNAAVAEKVVGQEDYLVYGLPLYFDSLVLVYNKAHFEEEGIKNPPVNWEQFFRTSNFLTKKDSSGKVIRSGAAFGNPELEFYTDIFGILLSNSNLNFPKDLEKESSSLNSVLRVLNRQTDWSPSFGNAGNAFVARKTSMIIVPSWRVNDLLTANPGIELGVAPLPSASIDNPKIWPTYFVEVVPKKAKNPNESWKFLRYLTSEESAKDIYSKQASVRKLPSLPARKSLSTSIDIDSNLKVLSNYANNSNSTHLNGSSIVFSDRAGNNKCVETVKSYIKATESEDLVEGIGVIKTDCGLK